MPLPMTKSVLALTREAYATARDAMPAYSHSRSPKVYTQHQLFAILVLRQFLKTNIAAWNRCFTTGRICARRFIWSAFPTTPLSATRSRSS